MATSEQKEHQINQHLDTLDNWLEDGPPDDTVSPEQFIRDLQQEARGLLNAIGELTPKDVDEIWQEETEEELV